MRQRGRRGAGSIRRRGKVYTAQWSGGKDAAGRRIRKTATFILRGDAEWWLREAGRKGEPPDNSQTVGEYLDRWLAGVKPTLRYSTWLSYEGHIRLHIKPMLGFLSLTALAPHHVDDLMAQLLRSESARGRPFSPTTVGKIVTTLRIALGRARKRHELPDNPAADVALPRIAEHPVEPLTMEEAGRVLAAARATWIEPIVRFLLGSGVRLGEACGLDQGDLHLDEGYVVVRRSKTRIRSVDVSGDAVEALRLALSQAPRRGRKEPVFFGPKTGERLTGSSVSHAFPRLLEAAGVARMTPHGLRHGTATLMLARGVPMRVIADQLGHANPAMTARVYAHVGRETRRAALDALDEAARQ